MLIKHLRVDAAAFLQTPPRIFNELFERKCWCAWHNGFWGNFRVWAFCVIWKFGPTRTHAKRHLLLAASAAFFFSNRCARACRVCSLLVSRASARRVLAVSQPLAKPDAALFEKHTVSHTLLPFHFSACRFAKCLCAVQWVPRCILHSMQTLPIRVADGSFSPANAPPVGRNTISNFGSRLFLKGLVYRTIRRGMQFLLIAVYRRYLVSWIKKTIAQVGMYLNE